MAEVPASTESVGGPALDAIVWYATGLVSEALVHR